MRHCILTACTHAQPAVGSNRSCASQALPPCMWLVRCSRINGSALLQSALPHSQANYSIETNREER